MIRLSTSPNPDSPSPVTLTARPMGIDTYQQPVVYMRADCPVCRSEGFESLSRVQVAGNGRTIIATVNVVREPSLLDHGEAGLSEVAWGLLESDGPCPVTVTHPEAVESFGHVRSKLFGHTLDQEALTSIVEDVAHRRYSDVQLSAFLAGGVGDRLNADEVIALTRAMVSAGEQLDWAQPHVFDKHCVGGLPGNRTTPLVVAITAACGVVMPKTSSRAITSPAGTADTMETLTTVELPLPAMRRVVEQEGACIVWGGSVALSPADDVLIRIERALDLDSEAQLVASVLSKKIAAGSSHALIDIPVGPTAKVRDAVTADRLATVLTSTGRALGLEVRVLTTDGTQPVGAGIGPALEARDVLAVLQNEPGAPRDLRARAAQLAGAVLEWSGRAHAGDGAALAIRVLNDGRAWRKFQSICEAQGGLKVPPVASHRHVVVAERDGLVATIDNRRLAKVAKLAGAPTAPAAGIELHAKVGDAVKQDQPIFTVYAEAPGELAYALAYLSQHTDLIELIDAVEELAS